MFDYIRRINRTFAALDIALPKECQAATALAEAAIEATNPTTADDLNDAIAAGTITPKNLGAKLIEAALALVAAERIHAAAEGTQSAITTIYYDGFRNHADKLVEALRTPFNEAAATLTAAARHFQDGATPQQILNAGPEAVTAWHGLDAARHTMGQVRTARAIIADIERDNADAYLHYIGGNHNQAELWHAEAQYTGVGDGLHNLATAGYTLHLNTRAEAAALARTAQTKSAKEQAAAEAARIAEHKASSSLAFELGARAALINHG
ncbi:hypothetical protein [Arthrobacter sp. PAMC25284]|uniref:hypothetical protein n=1 Tax=Arthrobacter sp. PAMC25284 TaxID=2861279 RepID=UPI001C62DFE7|nr:hypothetical protein [Arthrobacter sp. PAMC25284]QYF89711.1 hypothetical protein KY499_17070 [Arthrobacter sp. PAMC25284]